ncbi:efflux RND transporter periplasmic adaptor subunit [Pelagibacteraceae bacterium]|jgi:membrane fusion protein (multidrug efflux system)|nr:efflux RND transporter periplasmic adaptor subunit [Pelagibacteraceae bacterium]MDC0339931.1 efflux RND transporter periplasmic adaptor subunit [Pelagibacteraceae bacterium]MDC0366442.1 efflux RND transporter periplasmic adaptor subunit [Pelagibacteraceae bacterium]|tara:strand:- start:180 stop:1052 length:873 start_codon:yes stop_codon:yes gene_type:complete
MTTSTKLKTFLIITFTAIFLVIVARHFVGLHFKKKFSVRPAPGVIVETVAKSMFYKSIETFGTAIAQNSKTYRVSKDNIVGNLNIENRFVKKGEIIVALQNGENIIADFEGKLGKREIAQGVLGSNSLIITLDDLKKIVIDIKVPENYVGVLKPGLKTEITSSAFNKVFNGKVDSISSRIDPSTRSILARILVDNSGFEIIPGQLMTAKVIYNEENQVGVPESALTIQGDTAFVYVVIEGMAEKRNVVIGKRNFGKVSIVSGVSEGDLVISEGISKVRSKTKVKIIKPKN